VDEVVSAVACVELDQAAGVEPDRLDVGGIGGSGLVSVGATGCQVDDVLVPAGLIEQLRELVGCEVQGVGEAAPVLPALR
jgi:hypothetical protein